MTDIVLLVLVVRVGVVGVTGLPLSSSFLLLLRLFLVGDGIDETVDVVPDDEVENGESGGSNC